LAVYTAPKRQKRGKAGLFPSGGGIGPFFAAVDRILMAKPLQTAKPAGTARAVQPRMTS